MSQNRNRIDAVDELILEDLVREQPDYVPLVANRLGMHLEYVERRCQRLLEHDLIERVTGEAVYRVTVRGEAFLEEKLNWNHLENDD